ncbi:hypothetical protein K491DRAFT_783009 [Lophiostoma macrostomum CBS 122681]|uniref:Transmembrane protein n=1 Tax=Lophiostoma macrostomum CBS 122681 TaxID=1314788 RepID=A0A6A6SQE3_9PLEO|nr:hypothetical protein K491DRAFT_783009 [Lophiostoma macrostomum CBS 122681]
MPSISLELPMGKWRLQWDSLALHVNMRYSGLLLLGASSIAWAGVAPARPTITPAPSIDLEELELRIRQGDINLGSLAEVLATGVPPSILALALTNVPAVSRLLWSEFLDSNTPSWFTALPTDVQGYLSGEFGPTTTSSSSASTSSASSSAPTVSETAVSATADSGKPHGTGLPLWAKILIGVAVPLLILALFACVILCLVRRRRRRRMHKAGAESRAPTPAFIASSHRPRTQQTTEHVPLHSGHHSPPRTNHETIEDHAATDEMVFANRHHSSSSDEYTTPPDGHSYENIPPPPVFGTNHSARNSRQSFSSLHSVPEVPEPGAAHLGAGIAPPPRSPRRSSREFNQEFGNGTGKRTSPLNPAQNATYARGDRLPVDPYSAGQGIYAGGSNPYPSRQDGYEDYRHENPFADPSPPRERHMASGGYRGAAHDEELFRPANWSQHYEQNWPLTPSSAQRRDVPPRVPVGGRRNSWEMGDDPGHTSY